MKMVLRSKSMEFQRNPKHSPDLIPVSIRSFTMVLNGNIPPITASTSALVGVSIHFRSYRILPRCFPFELHFHMDSLRCTFGYTKRIISKKNTVYAGWNKSKRLVSNRYKPKIDNKKKKKLFRRGTDHVRTNTRIDDAQGVSRNFEVWQKYHARIAPYQPNWGIQDRKSVEDPQGKCGGVFEVSMREKRMFEFVRDSSMRFLFFQTKTDRVLVRCYTCFGGMKFHSWLSGSSNFGDTDLWLASCYIQTIWRKK